MSVSEIIEQVRALNTAEKRNLLEQIWTEFGDELGWVDSDLTPEHVAELDRRAEHALGHPELCRPLDEVIIELERRANELRRNPESGIPWEQLRTEMQERLAKRPK